MKTNSKELKKIYRQIIEDLNKIQTAEKDYVDRVFGRLNDNGKEFEREALIELIKALRGKAFKRLSRNEPLGYNDELEMELMLEEAR